MRGLADVLLCPEISLCVVAMTLSTVCQSISNIKPLYICVCFIVGIHGSCG